MKTMKLSLLVLLILFPSTVLSQDAGFRFFDDFSEPAAYPWIYGQLWGPSSEGMRMYDYQTTVGGGTLLACDSLLSQPIYIPADVESLYISVPMMLNANTATLPFGDVFNWERISVKAGSGDFHDVWEIYGTSFYNIHVYFDDTVLVAIPDSFFIPGDSLTIRVKATISSQPLYYEGYILIEWILHSVALMDTGGEELYRSTWGSIKAAF